MKALFPVPLLHGCSTAGPVENPNPADGTESLGQAEDALECIGWLLFAPEQGLEVERQSRLLQEWLKLVKEVR
jgi:hypothetical protein